ncbi:MAG TPA: sporulation transcriptional regulator SpoIIID [Pseudobacteroides sp.]|uniref:sporulation transcriptional regulator SpoIIID n=1 Tax=Pseudobacteroides sp. TaxID=1968840 RepID=UPI002F9477B9
MKEYISERVLSLANYTIANKATVRDTAKNFGISKSTVHKDIVERLMDLYPQLAEEVKIILEINKAERHIRGGNATRNKYKIST